jgi:hypothetical protein
MKRTFYLVLLIFSSKLMASGHHNHQNYQFTQVDLPFKQTRLGIKARLRNFSRTSDRKKMERGFEILKKVMNSKRFQQLVYGFVFNGERTFHENNGMSNEEIYQYLMTGGEVLKPEHDHTMDFDLSLYRSWNPFSKVKGYTLPDTMRIWIHKKFFRRKSWTAVDVAANLAHEWVHKMGFSHSYNYNPDRPFSVPYAIGGIVAQVAEEMGL